MSEKRGIRNFNLVNKANFRSYWEWSQTNIQRAIQNLIQSTVNVDSDFSGWCPLSSHGSSWIILKPRICVLQWICRLQPSSILSWNRHGPLFQMDQQHETPEGRTMSDYSHLGHAQRKTKTPDIIRFKIPSAAHNQIKHIWVSLKSGFRQSSDWSSRTSRWRSSSKLAEFGSHW